MPEKNENKTNRLINEKSPYLLQHAHNPVDWYPWGEEAFQKASNEDKPIFLSIGYSTCHWCHVMERESFTDEEVAKALNKVFISIKVDREERPDIDAVYMKACQLMTGGGGWPLTVLMTPDRKPFYIDTYIPKDSGYGKVGLLRLIEDVNYMWETDREHINEVAGNALLALRQNIVEKTGKLGEDTLAECYLNLSQSFDTAYGGFGHQPKFPIPHRLIFLLRYWHKTGEAKALTMVEKTLQSIRLGGIYDHVGGGIHRYSTDRQWLVPHFEKMLYDQALMALAFTEAYQATRDTTYREAAEDILDFVLSEMKHPEGAFFSAFDADSEGEEGKFYLWTAQEITEALDDKASLFKKVYSVKDEGNFIDASTRRYDGRNILHMTKTLQEVATETGLQENELKKHIDKALKKLNIIRNKREKPGLDDKVLASWNGLMIASLAKAGRTFRKTSYVEAAEKAAKFIISNMMTTEGRLLRRHRDGETLINGFAEDYAFTILGLIELYFSTFKSEYLAKANITMSYLLSNFWDKKNGGLFTTEEATNDILVRLKESYDGALPSANSVVALDLITLSRILTEPEMGKKAKEILSLFSTQVKSSPESHCFMLLTLLNLLGPQMEAIIVGEHGEKETESMLDALKNRYLPNTVVINISNQEQENLIKLSEYLEQYKTLQGKATAYVCINHACHQPTTKINTMLSYLKKPTYD